MGKTTTEPLSGYTAIVTGGGGAIGTSIAIQLAREGANITIAQRSETSANQVVKRIEEINGPGTAQFIRTDLTKESDIDNLVTETTDKFGGVEIVVNNAANPLKQLASKMDYDTWRSVIETNLTGPFLLAQRCFPQMNNAGYGRIINIGAIQSHSPLPKSSAYAASKAGLEGLTRSLAVEWSDNPEIDITSNLVMVGPVYGKNDIGESGKPIERINEEVPQELDAEAATLVGRSGRPSDVSNLVTFIASPKSSFITAAIIPCDGGRLISRKGKVFDP